MNTRDIGHFVDNLIFLSNELELKSIVAYFGDVKIIWYECFNFQEFDHFNGHQ